MPEIEEPDLKLKEKLRFFFAAHWRGFLCVIVPLILLPFLSPITKPMKWQWCAYTLILMAVFWVTECIPLAVTGFFPVVIFPMAGVMNTSQVCKCYVNDTVLVFLASLMLANSVEQSGLHKRLAYCAIRSIGYSHVKLLFAMSGVTWFTSLWITNTAATTMMVPINFAILRAFEDLNILKIFVKGSDGELISSDITTCYFCLSAFSATAGGTGTLIGSPTNLAMKGLFISAYPDAPEYLSFPKFSAWAIPYTIIATFFVWLYMVVFYCGFLRPNSSSAKSCQISDIGKAAAKKKIEADWKAMGYISFWEVMVICLFGGAMIGFFCRSPQVFVGWGDLICNYFGIEDMKLYILSPCSKIAIHTPVCVGGAQCRVTKSLIRVKCVRDSALAMMVVFLMMLLPSSLTICDNFRAKYYEQLPKGSVRSVLDWRIVHTSLPFSFMFLLGGGFALSEAAKTSGLNAKIADYFEILKGSPNIVCLFLISMTTWFVTNFASNVAVCNVFVPIAMQLAIEINQNPLWYALASGFSASHCFMIPVATPGNLVVKSAAHIPTREMIKAGVGPTISTLILSFLSIYFYAPIIWPDLLISPDWIGKS